MPNNEFHISSRKFHRRRKKPDIHPLQTLDVELKDKKEELTGKQKAAMLLKSLDSATAAELLKGVDAEAVQELAVELAHLDATGFNSKRQGLKLARQFCDSLRPNQDFRINGFLKEVLNNSVGGEKTEHIQSGIQELLNTNDPFNLICSTKPKTIAAILEKEHPQTAAVVLSEIPAEKKSEVLSFLDWGIRISIVNRMSNCGAISIEAKKRIAEVICGRLDTVTASDKVGSLPKQSKSSKRKLAVTLRNLGREIRDGLLGIIRSKDKHISEMLVDLMIFWEDIPQISNRSLQKVLRRIDIKKLALSLVKADGRLIQKIQLNLTEPMAAVLSEQMLLVSAYEREDIEQAREEIVDVLREMNEKGELAFIEE
ncbi:MAG: FliG C-terminal domain-containing protein [Planctomycetota bacterium]|jgi:flagellar motor switch protein FliG